MLKPMIRFVAGNMPKLPTADCYVTVNGERAWASKRERVQNQQQRARSRGGMAPADLLHVPNRLALA